ncbi:DEAD/DEAH box helicase [Microbacterium nymphoidis]|uniref:DEAD/DEAH box helicase n=1 Tax=Microbacterium nymphoidis TaxID=2898586 RepID=UPI001E3B9FD8|nr:DEAD/DEAH box helicase [Microbacterium nymphoidis]MCD2497866.1 DEAD/DEAH box helicase [Microbacterium nymphoidis]
MMTSSFLELGVPAPLVDVLAADGKASPFPIQAATLPHSLAGRDILGRGRTGSGKTIAFSLPLVARLAESRRPRTPGRPRGLVLAPTRELATQIAATLTPLADAVGLRVMTVFGGVSQKPQEQKLRAGTDIVVACPGRLEDLMKQGHVDLGSIEETVLDEADHMADLGFLPGVTRILSATPATAQRLLFSATLDNGVDKLVRRFMSDPVRAEVDELSVPAGEMTHRVLLIADAEEKTRVVRELASGTGRRILFMRTKHHAKKLAKQLTAAGIPAVDLQGNLSQGARERNLAAFSAEPEQGGVRVLVATDVAARGVHVDDVELVVHVDPPAEHKAYLHRSGRTARAGASGTVATLVLPTQKKDASDVLRAASIRVPFENADASSAVVAELVGEKAAYRAPEPVAPKQPQGKKKSGGRAESAGTRTVAEAAAESARGGSRRGGRGGRGRGQGGDAQRTETPAGQGGRGQSRRGQGGDARRGQAGESGRGQDAGQSRRGQSGEARRGQDNGHSRAGQGRGGSAAGRGAGRGGSSGGAVYSTSTPGSAPSRPVDGSRRAQRPAGEPQRTDAPRRRRASRPQG